MNIHKSAVQYKQTADANERWRQNHFIRSKMKKGEKI
jgi:hypothetical protein